MTSDEHYDGYTKYGQPEAQEYERVRATEPLWAEENAAIARVIGQRRPLRVLDVPVGTGRFLSLYPRQSEVFGVDVSLFMLAEARQRAASVEGSHVHLLSGDAARLCFADRAFDLTVCCRLLHLLPPRTMIATVAELARVTAVDVVVQVYAPSSFTRRLANVAGRAFRVLRAAVWTEAAPRSPWSHIRSYAHRRARIAAAFAAHRFALIEQSRLTDYCGAPVWILLFTRRG
jgi:ubiquinone/menaquinone biosynthesis C-methylase UbiE